MSLVDIQVPDMGDQDTLAVIELLVGVGDVVTAEQSLFTVESDKAAMEIPAPLAGIITAFTVQLGDQVRMGDVVGQMRIHSEAPAPSVPAVSAPPPATAIAATPAPASAPAPIPAPTPMPVAAAPANVPSAPRMEQPNKALVSQMPHASPSVRKFARELGVPLAEVSGSGPKGRITPEDIQHFTAQVMTGTLQTQAQNERAPAGGRMGLDLLPWPKVDFAKFGVVERRELSRIKKISGANLARNWAMIPHVTNHDEADITDLEALRVQVNTEGTKATSGVKVTMLAFILKAVAATLQKFPEFNASLDGDALIYKRYFHLGFAADTPSGLVVPVIKNVDQKGILQISQEMAELAQKARDGKLGAGDMQGGCFSISSLGGIGGGHFTPIINAPEVAILGVGKSQLAPKWDGQAFQPRLMLPMSLSWDHRVIDGATAARFNAHLGLLLADFRRMLL